MTLDCDARLRSATKSSSASRPQRAAAAGARKGGGARLARRRAPLAFRFVTASSARAGRGQGGSVTTTRGDAPAPAGFSVILVDISGSAKLGAVLDLVERYETCFKDSLRLVLIKSFRFACLVDRVRPFEAAPA